MQTQTDISDFQNPNTGTGSGNTAVSIAPKMLVDEVSPTEFYIGVSINGTNTAAPIWSIRQILQTGSVWAVTQYPNGDQGFNYVWDNRIGTYNYI